MSGFAVRHSVQLKSMLILLLGVTVTAVIFMAYSGYISNNRFNQAMQAKQARIENLTSLLASPLWNYDYAALERIERIIMDDRDILRLEVLDEGLNPVSVRTSTALPPNAPSQQIELPITLNDDSGKRQAGTLRVFIGKASLQQSLHTLLGELLTMLALLILVLFICVWLIQRQLVNRPLKKLLQAIENANNTRTFTQVEWQSSDEFGHIIRAFNAMQQMLSAQHQQITRSEQRFRALYNDAPAMLFGLTRDGFLLNTSQHLRQCLGYNLAYLQGLPLRELLTQHSQQHDYPELISNLRQHGQIREQALEVRTADGNKLDVVLHACTPAAGDTSLVAVMTDITHLRETQSMLDRQARCDSLTGLPNRRQLKQLLSQQLSADNARTSLMFIDLDRFKSINDTFGHSLGDELLRQAARRMQGCLKQTHQLCRLGGDEFAVIIEHQTDPADAVLVAQQILQTLEMPFALADSEIYMGASIGIARYPEDADNLDQLLQNADCAMYRAKDAGRNGYALYTPQQQESAREQLAMEHRLRQAIEHDHFILHYQAIIDLESGATVGAEALIRLEDPALGMISPADFIPIAEETGLIVPIGQWALHEACRQLREWRRQNPEFYLTVNVSTRQFQARNFYSGIRKLLQHYQLPGNALVLEITESLLMQDHKHIIRIMHKLAELGCRIAIDDFGTGYSALSYLQKFPVDLLKIDRSFTQGCTQPGPQRGLIEAILRMSESLGLDVITEGIENEEQWDYLRTRKCQLGQGFFFHRPAPAAGININPDQEIERFTAKNTN